MMDQYTDTTRKVTFNEDNLQHNQQLQQQQQHHQQQEQQQQEQQQEENKDQQEPPEQSPMTHTRKYTNVTFPRGFSPSQCSLLASRQRSTNYLCFSANELGELLTNQNTNSTAKKSKRKKKKKVKFSVHQEPRSLYTGLYDDNSNNHVTTNRGKCESWETRLHPGHDNTASTTNNNNEPHTGTRHDKPVVPVSNWLERTTSGRFRLAKLADNYTNDSNTASSRVNSGKTSLTGSKFPKTSQTRWTSNKEIARTLSAHVHSVLKISPSEILREVERVERTIQFVKGRSEFPPQTPVYLFSQKPSTRKQKMRGSSAF